MSRACSAARVMASLTKSRNRAMFSSRVAAGVPAPRTLTPWRAAPASFVVPAALAIIDPCFDPGGMGLDAEPLAAPGFVVVAIDGRGTPGRSKAFLDVSYGDLAGAGSLDDHVVAALHQLAASRPWMDLDRVGVMGHSGGGFAAGRALLAFPETYRAGVAMSGSHARDHPFMAPAHRPPRPADPRPGRGR
jgi:Prolyl oligopeptidase family